MTFPATMVFKTLRNSSSAPLTPITTGEGPSGKTWRGHSASFAKLKRLCRFDLVFRRILLLPQGRKLKRHKLERQKGEANPQSGPEPRLRTASIRLCPRIAAELQNLPVSLIRKVLPSC